MDGIITVFCAANTQQQHAGNENHRSYVQIAIFYVELLLFISCSSRVGLEQQQVLSKHQLHKEQDSGLLNSQDNLLWPKLLSNLADYEKHTGTDT